MLIELHRDHPPRHGQPQRRPEHQDGEFVSHRPLQDRGVHGLDEPHQQRLAPGDSLYRALSGVLPTSSSRFFDATALPGREYHYRIHFVIDGVLAANYSEDVATPGPLVPWVVDPDRGRLLFFLCELRGRAWRPSETWTQSERCTVSTR